MAKEIAAGVNEVEGMKARLRRSEEIAPMAIIESQERWKDCYETLQKEVPVATLDDLSETQGLILGSPTRYGNIEPSLGNFLETLGPLWISGTLLGKIGGVFCSTSTQHGGNEATLLTMMVPLMHLGYTIMPLGYCDPEVMSTAKGGTPYGPTTVAGGNDDEGPNEVELKLCRVFGRRIATLAKKTMG
jgi:NAD(P)H dehydrogenase (quinone)